MSEATDKKFEAFRKVLAYVNDNTKSDVGESVISVFGDNPSNVERISTGSIVLDSLTNGGFPKGRIIEIYGKEASGKTSFALTAAANVQKQGGTVVLLDLENAFDPSYAQKLGVDVNKLALSQPDYAEQALDIVEKLAKSRVVDLIIVDSVAAMLPKAEMEGDVEDVQVGTLARAMSKGLRKLVKPVNQSGTTVIFINQTRDGIGMFVSPEVTPGGKALKFFASMRVKISKKSKPVIDSATGEPIAVESTINIVKSKTSRPYRSGSTFLTMNKGVNQQAEIIEEGKRLGFIKSSGSSYSYANDELNDKGEPTDWVKIPGRGKLEVIKTLEEDKELFAKLKKKLEQALQAVEDQLNNA